MGTLNPWIEIWDLDLMDSLEPEFILGETDLPKKKSKKIKINDKNNKKSTLKINGHKDAVLDISYNLIDKHILASGSADKTICLWDLEEMKQAIKIKNHKKKVQSLKFHPVESFSLLSGSADGTVCLYDCRNPKENKKSWSLTEENEIEQVLWNKFEPNQFLSSDNTGSVYICDIRQDKPLNVVKAHESATTGLSLSSKVPGLLVTASEEEYVKIWDVQGGNFDLVHSKKLKIVSFKLFLREKESKITIKILLKGPLNCGKSSPDSDFVFAFGGIKSTSPLVFDIRESKEVRTRFYPRMNLSEENEERKLKEEKAKKRIERAQKFKELKKATNSASNNKNSINRNAKSDFSNKRKF